MCVHVYVYKADIHVFPGRYHETCGKHEHCGSPLECINGTCSCPTNTVFKMGLTLLLPSYKCIPNGGKFSFANSVNE